MSWAWAGAFGTLFYRFMCHAERMDLQRPNMQCVCCGKSVKTAELLCSVFLTVVFGLGIELVRVHVIGMIAC
jgi:hypothetical protein